MSVGRDNRKVQNILCNPFVARLKLIQHEDKLIFSKNCHVNEKGMHVTGIPLQNTECVCIFQMDCSFPLEKKNKHNDVQPAHSTLHNGKKKESHT